MEQDFFQDQLELLILWWYAADAIMVGFAVAIPVVVWVSRGVFADMTTWLVARAASKFQINVSQEVRAGAKPAAAAFCVFLSLFLSFQLLMLPGPVASWLVVVVRICLIFSIFWLIDAFFQCALKQFSGFRSDTKVIQKSWLPQFIRLILLILMVVVLLKSFGIDLGPALTGLGIAGAAVALAAQDLIRNLIAGVNIAGEKRFTEGDWINFGAGTDGIVENLQLRSTVIRKFDQSVIHVPNSDLANAPLTNFSSREIRRLFWKIRVPLETESKLIVEACEKISHFIETSPHFRADENTHHFVTSYSIDESYMSLLVDCFVSTNEWEAELLARKELIAEIRKVFHETGIQFALPSQRILTEAGS